MLGKEVNGAEISSHVMTSGDAEAGRPGGQGYS